MTSWRTFKIIPLVICCSVFTLQVLSKFIPQYLLVQDHGRCFPYTTGTRQWCIQVILSANGLSRNFQTSCISPQTSSPRSLGNGHVSWINTVLYLFHLFEKKWLNFPSHSKQQATNNRKYLALLPLDLLSNNFPRSLSPWISDKSSNIITEL